MRVSPKAKMIPIKNTLLGVSEFIRGSRKLDCHPYIPIDPLRDAFDQYGILEIYVDGLSRSILGRTAVARGFIQRQKQGLSLKDNLEVTFEGHQSHFFLHEDGPLSIVANKRTLRERDEIDPNRVPSRQEDLLEVMEAETSRDSERPSRPNLDEIEGNIRSADNFLLLAQTISGEAFEEDHPDLILPGPLRERK